MGKTDSPNQRTCFVHGFFSFFIGPGIHYNSAAGLDEKLISIEENLIQRKLTGGRQDALRWPIRLYAKLLNLAEGVDESDFAPTTQQVEVHETYKAQLSEVRRRLDEVLGKDLAEFNDLLKAKNIPHIVSLKP